MTSSDQDDALLRALSRLPTATPDLWHGERILNRSHAVLTRRHLRITRRHGLARRVLAPALVYGFSLAYLIAIVRDVLEWRGLF